MRRLIASAVFFVFSGLVRAPGPSNFPNTQVEPAWQRVQRQLWEWQMEDRWSVRQREAEARRAAELVQHREFTRKVSRFVKVWKKFIDEYNRQGTFNVKTARELDKAFRDLQTDGWPK